MTDEAQTAETTTVETAKDTALSEIFRPVEKSTEAKTAETTQDSKPETEGKATEVKEAKATETDDAKPDEDGDKDTRTVPLKALEATRHKANEKTKALEDRLALIEARLADKAKAAEAAADDEPLIPDDADLYDGKVLNDAFAKSEKRVLTKLEAAEQRLAVAEARLTLKQSQLDMKAVHPDFDDAIKAYEDAAENDPAMKDILSTKPLDKVTEYVYKVGRTLLQTKGGEVDIDALVEQRVAEALAKKAEDDAAAAKDAVTKGVPRSITDGGVSRETVKSTTAHTPTEELFLNRRKA